MGVLCVGFSIHIFSDAFSPSRSRNEMIGTWLSTELDKRPLSGKLAALSVHIVISGLDPRDRSRQGKKVLCQLIGLPSVKVYFVILYFWGWGYSWLMGLGHGIDMLDGKLA